MKIKNSEDRQVMLKEFDDIVRDIESKIKEDKEYSKSKEFQLQKAKLTTIMTTVEGCGCNGRGTQLAAMFRSLSEGNTGVARTFAPLVFKSFYIDFKKILKIM